MNSIEYTGSLKMMYKLGIITPIYSGTANIEADEITTAATIFVDIIMNTIFNDGFFSMKYAEYCKSSYRYEYNNFMQYTVMSDSRFQQNYYLELQSHQCSETAYRNAYNKTYKEIARVFKKGKLDIQYRIFSSCVRNTWIDSSKSMYRSLLCNSVVIIV